MPARPNREPEDSRSGPEAALPQTTLRTPPHLPPFAQTPRSAPPTAASQSRDTTRRAPAPTVHSEPISMRQGLLPLPIGAHPGEPTASARAGGFKNGPIPINGPRRRCARMRSPARQRCYGSTGAAITGPGLEERSRILRSEAARPIPAVLKARGG